MRGRAARLGFGVFGALTLALLPLLAMAATSSPNDYFFTRNQQWSLTGAPASINAPAGWCATLGDGVLVADIDTGANFTHEDLQGRLVRGQRFTDSTGNPSPGGVDDDFGHGTMTTGLMVANYDNGLGIAGVAPHAKALVVKVLDNTGHGYDTDIAAGVNYAVDQGAQVLNLSLGGVTAKVPGFDAIGPALANAVNKGRAVVVAAGNDSLPVGDYGMNGVLSVGALGRDGKVAPYSSGSVLVGVNISLYAPGGNGPGGDPNLDVVSTYFGGSAAYASGDGTSFAAPLVAGTVALLVAHGYSPQDASKRVVATAPTNASGVKQLDAAAALGVNRSASCTNATGSSPHATPPAGGGATPGRGASGAGATAGGGASPGPGQLTPASPSASGSPGAVALNPGATPSPSAATNVPLQVVVGGGLNPAFLLAAGGFAALAGAATFLWLRQTGRL